MKLARSAVCALAVAATTALPACAPSITPAAYSTPGLGAASRLLASPKLVIAGFNEARGGGESFQDPAVSGLRSAIRSAFKGAKFKFSGQLSAHFLSHTTVVVLGVLTSATHGIAPLRHREQNALKNFVKGGGSAILFTDNDSFDAKAAAQNASLLSPFGLQATGTLNGSQIAGFVGSPNPIQTGPFGTAGQLDTYFPGWFTALGNAGALATFAYNGEPALAYLPAHGGSGAVVFFSDASMMLDVNRTNDDLTAILNALSVAL